jgi:enediyne biosynthesis protein CalE5
VLLSVKLTMRLQAGRLWETIERGAQKVSDKIVQLAEIQPGDKVLDIATGIGEPAVTAARKVMPNGKVIATDA